jgi:hypothetical protein
MPLLPPTLATLRPCSHTSRLPRLVVELPLVLRHLSISSCPTSHLAAPPPLAALPPHVVPLFIAGAVVYRPPWLFFMSPFVTLTPSVHWCLRLSSYHCLFLLSCLLSALAGGWLSCGLSSQQCPIALKVHMMQHPLVRTFAREKATSCNMHHNVLCSSGCDRCEEQAKIG